MHNAIIAMAIGIKFGRIWAYLEHRERAMARSLPPTTALFVALAVISTGKRRRRRLLAQTMGQEASAEKWFLQERQYYIITSAGNLFLNVSRAPCTKSSTTSLVLLICFIRSTPCPEPTRVISGLFFSSE